MYKKTLFSIHVIADTYIKSLFSIYDVYLKFPKIQTLSGQLSWSHNSEIIKVDDKFVNKGAYSW